MHGSYSVPSQISQQWELGWGKGGEQLEVGDVETSGE